MTRESTPRPDPRSARRSRVGARGHGIRRPRDPGGVPAAALRRPPQADFCQPMPPFLTIYVRRCGMAFPVVVVVYLTYTRPS